jgi:catechol 2,3-dioxygenase-like lactoylglutathione lyase family enzyme
MGFVQSTHHITLCTGTAQGDVDFFVKTLGLRMVKQTLLYDGAKPILHLYFADRVGTPGAITTSFPMRQTGVKGKRGTGQIWTVTYSAPAGSLDFWREHLPSKNIPVSGILQRFGYNYIAFKHPECDIDFEILEDPADTREQWDSPYVPAAYALRGFHSWTFGVREFSNMDFFMTRAWGLTETGRDAGLVRYQIGEGGPGKYIDLRVEEDIPQGSWTFGEGTVHHGAFAVPDKASQSAMKFEVEGLGYTDFSDLKDRGYFESIYVRSPGGVLVEACTSLGFTVDEEPDKLGQELQISPQFKAQKAEILRQLNDPFVL